MDKVKFICPKCACERLECVERGFWTDEILEFDEHGDFDYGDPIVTDGEVLCYQCCDCGYTLKSENGEFINENLEAYEWVKNNSKRKLNKEP